MLRKEKGGGGGVGEGGRGGASRVLRGIATLRWGALVSQRFVSSEKKRGQKGGEKPCECVRIEESRGEGGKEASK